VRGLAHQFQFGLQHINAPLSLGFRQIWTECLGLISVEGNLPQQGSLLGSHLGDDLRLTRHVSITVPGANLFLHASDAFVRTVAGTMVQIFRALRLRLRYPIADPDSLRSKR
jgi:hypothetical protein